MKATYEQNENARKLGLIHQKKITSGELNLMLKKLNISYNMFIDPDTTDEFIDKTAFSFHHNYDNYNNNNSYTLTDLR